jgi:hypothetical protein
LPVLVGLRLTNCRNMVEGRCTSPLALPLYGDRPSAGVCRICEHHRGLPRGLGDVIETATRLTGLKWLWSRRQAQTARRQGGNRKASTGVSGAPCGGCAARRRALNERFPTKG